jgi:hypothetical protein
MRQHTLVLLMSVLLTSPLLAQQRPQGLELSRSLMGKRAAALPSFPLNQRAFFSLAGALVPPGSRELTFEVRIDGRLALQDVIRLPFDSAGGTVELLAGDPAGLANLLARAEKAGKSQFSVSLDGRTLETFTLAELRAYNKRFQDSLPVALKPAGEVRTFASTGEPVLQPRKPQGPLTKDYDPSCVASCDAQRDDCYQTEPSCEGVEYCEVCEDQWSSCYNGCWVCTDPKSVTEYTTSSLYSATYYGSSCLQDFWGTGYWFDYYSYVIRNYRWQRTEYCNGSHTDTLLYTWDTSGTCQRNSYFSCSFPFGTAWGPFCPF